MKITNTFLQSIALIIMGCSQSTPVVRAITPLSDTTLQNIPSAGSDFDINNQAGILAPILIPRVAGTEGSVKVRQHFADFFTTQLPKWNIEYQNSTSKTPVTGNKDVPFVNMIMTRDPPWATPGNIGRLTLVAHYDSKLEPKGFIGAVDSAAPCAMLMHAARSLDEALTRKWDAMIAAGEDGLDDDEGIQILFLDGEEAMKNWSEEDSLYGARSLAAEWENTPHAVNAKHRSRLNEISLFVLLDLLGSANPTVPSYWSSTHWAYKNMAALEKRLRNAPVQVMKSKPVRPFLIDAEKKDKRWTGLMMQDDHVPFVQRGVEVLHLIPSPFPAVWHRMTDDGEHLDMDTVEDWAKLTIAFAAEWLDLEGHFPPMQSAQMEKRVVEDDYEKTEL